MTEATVTRWLARRWRATAWIWRLVLVALVAGLGVINAAGVYTQLVNGARLRRQSRRKRQPWPLGSTWPGQTLPTLTGAWSKSTVR